MRYEIDITDIDIGKGGYGKILKGWYGTKTRDVHGVQRVMGPCVAYKLPSDDSNKSKLLQLKNEIHILRKLRNKQHPNIVKVYEMWETEFIHKGKPISTCIAMEYCSRGSFKNLMEREIEKERYLERHFIDLLWQAACAVEFLHNNGIVHADIKPSNFVVTRNGVVKLIDFGSAFEDDFVKFLTAVDIGFKKTDASSFENEGYTSEFLLRKFFNKNREEVKEKFKNDICDGKDYPFRTAFNTLRELCEERGYASPKGTHGYYPEEFNITGPTKKTDVYSFGKMMEVMEKGRPHFLKENERKVFLEIVAYATNPDMKFIENYRTEDNVYLQENIDHVSSNSIKKTTIEFAVGLERNKEADDRYATEEKILELMHHQESNVDVLRLDGKKTSMKVNPYGNREVISGADSRYHGMDDESKTAELNSRKNYPLHADRKQRNMSYVKDKLFEISGKSWSCEGNSGSNSDIINEMERIKDVKVDIHDWLFSRIIHDSFDSHEHHITDYLLKFKKRVNDNGKTRRNKINVCYCGNGNGATVMRKAVEETKKNSLGSGYDNNFDIELHADFTG